MDFGLIGKSLTHSLSPEIHRVFGDYDYELVNLCENEIADFFARRDFIGINVTIPYKCYAFALCDEVSPSAFASQSVNTVIKRADGTLFGDNTDCFGLNRLLEHSNISVNGKKVLILGNGGAANAARIALSDADASDVITVSRNGEINFNNVYEITDADVIINATPVGMFPKNGERIIDIKRFPSLCGVVDMIYNPLSTPLLYDARQLGIAHANGLYMLAAQAFKSAELFLNKPLQLHLTDKAERVVRSQRMNIVLVGMPGSGKSTVGLLLAEKLDKVFVDTDAWVENDVGLSISEIFSKNGEEFFRNAESRAVEELSRSGGLVIATGGGAVLRECNCILLRQNAFVVFLQRELHELAISDRPLSVDLSRLTDMAAVRTPLYEQLCDASVENSGSVDEVVQAVIDTLAT